MGENRIRQILEQGGCTVSSRLWSPLPAYVEAMGASGNFDYVEFVAEYAPFSQADLENFVRAAELHHMGSMIKVDFENRGYVAQKAIASGFQAVLFTDHETPRQVEESIRLTLCRCPADGGRMGFSNRRFVGGDEELAPLERADRVRRVVRCFMIEKAPAVEHIREICALPGVDMVQFGGMDWCMSLGLDPVRDKALRQKAEEEVIRAALEHGVRPRCEISDPAQAEYYARLGVRDFSLSDDMGALRRFWNREGEALRAFADGL